MFYCVPYTRIPDPDQARILLHVGGNSLWPKIPKSLFFAISAFQHRRPLIQFSSLFVRHMLHCGFLIVKKSITITITPNPNPSLPVLLLVVVVLVQIWVELDGGAKGLK